MVLDVLAALIDKSLVTVDDELDGDARYRLLDMIKEYAAVRLAASGEADAIRQRHREYLLNLAESIVAKAFVRGDPPWPERIVMYRRVHAERANLIAALALSAERGEAAHGLRLCCALRSPWVAYGDVTEGAALVRPVPHPGRARSARSCRARALMLRAELAFEQQDYPAAAGCATAGIELGRDAAGQGEAGGRRLLALVSLRAGRHDEALAERRMRRWRRPRPRAMTGRKASGTPPGRPCWPARAGWMTPSAAYRDRAGRAAGQQRLGRGAGAVRARRGWPGRAASTPRRCVISMPRWCCTGRSTPGRTSPGAWPGSAGWRFPSAT